MNRNNFKNIKKRYLPKLIWTQNMPHTQGDKCIENSLSSGFK